MAKEEKKVFYSPSGDAVREEFLFDEDWQLQKVGEHDIQKEINEAAKGLKVTEQIQRMARGDQTVIRPGQPFYGDVSEVPESRIDEINGLDAQIELAVKKALAKKEPEKGKAEPAGTIEEAEAQLKAAQEKLSKLKGVQENAK